jgi:hypothetical protein
LGVTVAAIITVFVLLFIYVPWKTASAVDGHGEAENGGGSKTGDKNGNNGGQASSPPHSRAFIAGGLSLAFLLFVGIYFILRCVVIPKWKMPRTIHDNATRLDNANLSEEGQTVPEDINEQRNRYSHFTAPTATPKPQEMIKPVKAVSDKELSLCIRIKIAIIALKVLTDFTCHLDRSGRNISDKHFKGMYIVEKLVNGKCEFKFIDDLDRQEKTIVLPVFSAPSVVGPELRLMWRFCDFEEYQHLLGSHNLPARNENPDKEKLKSELIGLLNKLKKVLTNGDSGVQFRQDEDDFEEDEVVCFMYSEREVFWNPVFTALGKDFSSYSDDVALVEAVEGLLKNTWAAIKISPMLSIGLFTH